MISKEEVKLVALNLMLDPNNQQINYVIENYEEESNNDPSGNLELWVENLLYTQDCSKIISNTLYYVVEKQLKGIDDFEETTGWKTITCYTVEDNVPKIFFDIETHNNRLSESEIQEWLDNNGYEDTEFKFIVL